MYPHIVGLLNGAKHYNSSIDKQLSAGVLRSSKLITKPCCNISRNKCRGEFISSLHAEANAIINYYGKDISYDGTKWRCVKKHNRKKINYVKNVGCKIFNYKWK